ncbi:putative lipoprotein [Hyphomonas neptunium ATCC 15444]|uniref:Putative lipoprotein n=2 Tax=Hyphomonas TaxID=85 RepID=Q0BWH5_HYPNA|nr:MULTISPECIES: amidohydrolase [Hyphomonas]ABI77929.1 putative lipoprotein [Hyphomonas neptunium ATCC 15444]KCZ94744.1 putative lipoprotein [Hyphomonas hirschiana VP5]
MRFIALAALAAIALAACVEPSPATPGADGKIRIFTGGTIYTGLEDPATVDAIVVGPDGRILGTTPPLSKDWSEEEVETIDLSGAVMFPGFTDAHAHLQGIGERELRFTLEGTASIDELVTRVEAELQGKPPGEILLGRGWIETGWPEGRMPSAADLDAVSPDNPVILVRSDGHALVANTLALKAANIYDIGADSPGGFTERDENFKATGIVIDESMYPVMALVEQPTYDQMQQALEIGAKTYASRGWTGVHNMSADREHGRLLKELDDSGRLPLRVYNAFEPNGSEITEGRQYETARITNRAVKLYIDGALGSRGALLIEPYSDRPETSGLEILDIYGLHNEMMDAQENDVQLSIHAIGDLANRNILDKFEELGYGADLRWRIEHAQMLHPDDIDRLATSGLIPSMQPSHAIGDLHFAPARVGIDRLRGAYAWASLLKAGAVIAGGSDAPVEVGSPTIEFYAAVARKDLKGFSGEGWHPEEAVTRQQALKLFTTGPAFASFQENDLGTIETGKIADFTVFDRDLMTIPEAEILEAKPVMTVVAGEIVFDGR